MKLRKHTTQRGFRIVSFRDRYDKECSLQESSLASEAAIWLGCDDPEPRVLVPGKGWQPVPMPDGYVATTRMHLTQSQVKELLPHLQRFVETGQLGKGEPDATWAEEDTVNQEAQS